MNVQFKTILGGLCSFSSLTLKKRFLNISHPISDSIYNRKKHKNLNWICHTEGSYRPVFRNPGPGRHPTLHILCVSLIKRTWFN